MACKYNESVICDRSKTPCESCAIDKCVNAACTRVVEMAADGFIEFDKDACEPYVRLMSSARKLVLEQK